MSRIARVQVVIFTPLGMYPQEYDEGDADAWGMDGGHWQTHRSGWFPAELARVGEGWEAVVVPEFHHADQHGERWRSRSAPSGPSAPWARRRRTPRRRGRRSG